jgi:transcriptional regulator GlxA family with amidase domain
VHLLSAHGGPITSNGAVTIATEPLSSLATSAVDTLLFSGGDDDAVLNASASPVVQEWILQAARPCRRVGSICSGALALARLGYSTASAPPRTGRPARHWPRNFRK